jgi:DnaK suppressor protein
VRCLRKVSSPNDGESRHLADKRKRVRHEGLAQLDGEVGDDVDRAFVKTQVGQEHAIIDRCVAQLGEIARAQDRIASGEFGICADCNEPIESARLDFNPAVSRCTECEARRELAARIAMR